MGDLLAVLNDRFPFEPNRLAFRVQVVNVASDQVDATLSVLPHGDYVLGLLHDENGNFQPDPGEAGWLYNQDQGAVKGFVFDVLKFSFREPERRFDVQMHYPGASAH